MTWPMLAEDGLTLFFSTGGTRFNSEVHVATRASAQQSFGTPRTVLFDGQPLQGRSPRYVAATRELFLSHAPGDKGTAKDTDLYVIKNFDPAHVAPTVADDRRAAEWVLKAGGSVKVEADGVVKEVKAGGRLPAGPFTLRWVRFEWGNPSVTDETMANLAGLSGLQELMLGGAGALGDAGVAQLRGLSTLKTLALDSTRVGDAGADAIGKLANLETLTINGTRITDKGVERLAALPSLRTLWLSHTQVTDEALKHLSRLAKLETLQLADTPISDAGVPHLAALKSLRQLDMPKSRVTTQGLRRLKEALPNCKITPEPLTGAADPGRAAAEFLLKNNAGVGGVAGGKPFTLQGPNPLPEGPVEIHAIEGSHCPALTDDALAQHASGLAKLKSIKGHNMVLTGVGFRAFRESALEVLHMGNGSVTDAGLEAISRIKTVREINVRYHRVTDAGLKHLSSLPNLVLLSLHGNNISDAGMKDLAKCANLQILYVSDTDVGDAGVAHLAGLKLTTLGIGRTKVTDKALEHLKGMTTLNRLYIGRAAVTEAGLSAFRKALPNCDVRAGPAVDPNERD